MCATTHLLDSFGIFVCSRLNLEVGGLHGHLHELHGYSLVNDPSVPFGRNCHLKELLLSWLDKTFRRINVNNRRVVVVFEFRKPLGSIDVEANGAVRLVRNDGKFSESRTLGHPSEH